MSDTKPTVSSLVLDGQNQFWSIFERYGIPFEKVLSVAWSKESRLLYQEDCWAVHIHRPSDELVTRLACAAVRTHSYEAAPEEGGATRHHVFVPDSLGRLVLFHWIHSDLLSELKQLATTLDDES